MRRLPRALGATTAAAVALLLAGCFPGTPPVPRVVPETEPNDGGANDPGTVVPGSLPVRITGQVSSGDTDRFLLDIPAPGGAIDYVCTAGTTGITIEVFDLSLGSGSGGGCGSDISVATDGGEVSVTISSFDTEPYAIDLLLVQP